MKYICMSKIFLKIDFTFYSNITTHNQIYEYVYLFYYNTFYS